MRIEVQSKVWAHRSEVPHAVVSTVPIGWHRFVRAWIHEISVTQGHGVRALCVTVLPGGGELVQPTGHRELLPRTAWAEMGELSRPGKCEGWVSPVESLWWQEVS